MQRLFLLSCLFASALVLMSTVSNGDWGFYGHRLINRMAVYTLPPEMMFLYKPNLEFISEHAVDPDKRRYASPFEASRHFIDLDRWGDYPYNDLPRTWIDALIKYTNIQWQRTTSDSIIFYGIDSWKFLNSDDSSVIVTGYNKYIRRDFRDFFVRSIMPHYYDDEWQISCALWKSYLSVDSGEPCIEVLIQDSLSHYGILPYHLVWMQQRLTQAFISQNLSDIVRLSAEIGHYIGDAHVPLHTTKNYNGQLTDQIGIHAFWESRIPELFAESEYDFLVGKAKYISDPSSYYWNIILESNAMVDSVLLIEKSLSLKYPSDQRYCFDERLERTVRVECEEYARAYQVRLNGMVEDRMRQSILAIGSAWYTAWVDAGQPAFSPGAGVSINPDNASMDLPKRRARIRVRKHE